MISWSFDFNINWPMLAFGFYLGIMIVGMIIAACAEPNEPPQ